jgi:hypothetical protein
MPELGWGEGERRRGGDILVPTLGAPYFFLLPSYFLLPTSRFFENPLQGDG